MGEAGSRHMKWLQLVRQPYFSNGSHARAGVGFLEADLRAWADAVRVICAFSPALRATTNSADDLGKDIVFVPLNNRGTKPG
ncbi:hypothetical protein ACUTJJ_01485 [Agrobacterium sp. DKPNP3]|uniref:hypothetical protein n=1 Tax=Agrobacterium TaxID=357 RepID=UPI001AD98ECD|nr:hypothetical protein [Agrobacterium tumefaciens]